MAVKDSFFYIRGETVSNTTKRKLLRISELDESSDTYTPSACCGVFDFRYQTNPGHSGSHFVLKQHNC